MTRCEQTAVRCGPQQGFTLIEVLVASGLMAIVMMGLQSLLVTTIRANTLANTTTAATTLAQQKIELLRNTAYSSVALTSGTSDTVSPYTRTWVITNGPATNTKSVTVSVSWPAANGTQTVQLNTILTN